jgi:hypothetical protein
MQFIAVKIQNDTLRTSFLENVPAHRELSQLLEQLQG